MYQIGHQNLQIVTNILSPTSVINMDNTMADTDAGARYKNWKAYLKIYVLFLEMVETAKLRGSAIGRTSIRSYASRTYSEDRIKKRPQMALESKIRKKRNVIR